MKFKKDWQILVNSMKIYKGFKFRSNILNKPDRIIQLLLLLLTKIVSTHSFS